MTIDIIDYTEEQLKALSKTQLARVEKAQLRKNRLERKLQDNLQKVRDGLIKNGTFVSELYALTEDKLCMVCDEEISAIRADLVGVLAASKDTADVDKAKAYYYIDYSWPYEKRFDYVKNYYMETYTDGAERFEKFLEDEVAMRYLGEYYAPLYDYLLALS